MLEAINSEVGGPKSDVGLEAIGKPIVMIN